jgi:hypothetical protein
MWTSGNGGSMKRKRYTGEQIAGVEGLEHLGTCVLGACRPLDGVCRGLRVVVEVETLEAERRPHEVASEPLQTSLVHR